MGYRIGFNRLLGVLPRPIAARQIPAAGFTLIELLVVISIIGLLASIVLASLSSARSRASDARRASDVKSLKTAMELYYDAHLSYPQYSTANGGHPVSGLSTYLNGYIAQISPLLISDGDSYVWGSSGQSWAIHVLLSDGTTCKTGANVNSGWWGTGVPQCQF